VRRAARNANLRGAATDSRFQRNLRVAKDWSAQLRKHKVLLFIPECSMENFLGSVFWSILEMFLALGFHIFLYSCIANIILHKVLHKAKFIFFQTTQLTPLLSVPFYVSIAFKYLYTMYYVLGFQNLLLHDGTTEKIA
jgi:hypothetical protein